MRDVRKMISYSMLVTLFIAISTQALPVLQLDVSGGEYDASTETVMATSDVFTVYALLDLKNGETFGTFNLTMALTPAAAEPISAGSFLFNGNIIDVTTDLTFGTPDAPEGFQNHGGFFPTFYYAQTFTFSPSQKATAYDVQTNAGDFEANANGSLYYQEFSFDISSLDNGYGLHFDVYGDVQKGNKVMVKNAPFSHDAGAQNVPEPATTTLLGLALLGIGFFRRKAK